jgi:peptidyl-prolyl cis-trans isomerase SurA
MQRIFPWIAAGVLFVAGTAQTAEEMVDGIVAQVGEEVVLFSEVMDAIGDVEKRMRADGAAESDIAKLQAAGLERMIEQKMIANEVDRMELYASDREVDEAIELKAQEIGITVAELRDSVESEGLPFDKYREAYKGQIEYQKVVQISLMPKIQIDEQELRRRYDQRYSDQPDAGELIHLRQLMVPISKEVDASAACAEVKAAAELIAGGEAFEAVASKVSVIAPQKGGDIGWLHVESLAPWMAELVADLEPGGISAVSSQAFGCNLLKVVERRAFERMTYEKAEDNLYMELRQEKMEQEFIKWMNELREHTYIKRRGYFADAAVLDTGLPESAGSGTDPLIR